MRKSLALGLALTLTTAALAQSNNDTCSIRAGRTDEKLTINWEHGECTTDHCHHGDSDMLWTRWSGITAQDLEREGAAIDARMKADAGEMRCTGTVHDAALRGTWSFTPDPAFIKKMEAMGFDSDAQTPDRLQTYAMLDITTDWVKQMKDAGVAELNAHNIVSLKALKIDPAYVKGMADAGYPELRAQKLTSMKAVGVTPQKVQEIRAMGYTPTQEQLVQMSVFKIDAAFVERVKAHGFQNPTIAQLIKIKIFKLDE